MEYGYSDGCWTPTHIVHGRTVGFFKTTAKFLRCMAALTIILSGTGSALRLSGIREGPPHAYIICFICSTIAVSFMVFRYVTGRVSEMVEAIFCTYLFLVMMTLATISGFFYIDEFDIETAVRACMLRPQIASALFSVASYFEVCGTQFISKIKYCAFLLWILSITIGVCVCTHPRFSFFVGPMMVCSCFQLIVMISGQGFVKQAMEWALLTSQLLETAFDATFVLRFDKTMSVDTSSSGLDRVFQKRMQGCALDDTIIVNGVEAVRGLSNNASSDGNESSIDETMLSKRDGRRCALVTCRDADGWEFDAEFRSAPQLASNMNCSSTQLCGLIVFGEKRQPLDNDCNIAAPVLEDPQPEDDPIIVRTSLSPFSLTRRQEALVAIPEDKVSLGPASTVSKEESLGTQVDHLLDMLSKLKRNCRAKKNREHYKLYKSLASHLQDSIDDVLYQTECQLPCVIDERASAQSVESSHEQQEQMGAAAPEPDVVEVPKVVSDEPASTPSQVRLRRSAIKHQE